jgi:hypothetical protein
MRRGFSRPFALVFALAILTGLAGSNALADSKASSLIRDIAGRREVRLATASAGAILDSLVARGTAQGDSLIDLDREHGRLVLERTMAVDEASVLRTPPDGTERVRLRFEVVQPGRAGPPLTVVGAILLVTNPGAAGEQIVDLGKKQPYRNELKAWMSGLQESFGRR